MGPLMIKSKKGFKKALFLVGMRGRNPLGYSISFMATQMHPTCVTL